MNKMRLSAIIACALGMILVFVSNIVLGTYFGANIIGITVCNLAVLFDGVLTLASLSSNRKDGILGMSAIIFLGIVGGILYLCWKPEEELE